MTEVGSASISDEEAARLRDVSAEGRLPVGRRLLGQLRVGVVGGAVHARCCRRPSIRSSICRRIIRCSHAQFEIKKVPQIASIGYWASTGGDTSERGDDSAVAHTRAVLDKHGNIMVLMTHNTDLGDSFEREADDPQYFYQMSVPGYAFGINALLYAMTH